MRIVVTLALCNFIFLTTFSQFKKIYNAADTVPRQKAAPTNNNTLEKKTIIVDEKTGPVIINDETKLIDTVPKTTHLAASSMFRDTSIKGRNIVLVIRERVPRTTTMRIIKGQVKDRFGNGISNVTVRALGLPAGTVTDREGRFSLSVENVQKLKFSMVGYAEMEMDVNQSNFSFNGISIQSNLSQFSNQTYETRSTSLNMFPLPYPVPSARYTLPAPVFSKTKLLYQVDSVLQKGLDGCRYNERRYYYIPHGFALVTQMEQIHEDGRSMEEPDRWSSTIGELNNPWDYIKALFSTPKGYYRVLVFLVTDVDHSAGGNYVSELDAMKWLNNGYNNLPKEIRSLSYNGDYTVTLLVYHYTKSPGEDGKFISPDTITGMDHYIKAGLTNYIR
jgi:hypothetical protein